ncbi:3'-5' exonuclease [Streptomyces actinomycinicus]|uniref:3'-5' exonuclease n=1 Tax=Streptomyces actinomycinicus TaxID=1695166 RepID=A0A937ENZ9_9ACTN|nr:3'-5' exonuclease [Streptomyces actinomycinicus]MBL1086853.1 3'-5' exonuclease [Streptomyces actinomycinicus]
MGRRKGFGPVQLANHAGLAQWQVERGQPKGLIPAPALDSGRWSDEQADDVQARRDQIVEVLGTHPGYGAKRGAQMLAQAPDLLDRKLEVWACDVEQLAEQGLLECVGEFGDYPLYDERQLTSPTPQMCAALEQIVAERVAWLHASARADEAAGRCGWEVAEFEKAAEEQDIRPGRFGRWALEDVERLAGNEDLGADILAARMLGPELAAQHLEIRRRDLDYCIEAGWLAPVSHVRRTVWSGGRGHQKVVDVPMYRVGDLDALKDIPGVDWEAVRATKPGRPSPLRAFAQLAPQRAAVVRAFVDELRERFGLPVWTRFANLDNRWLIDWEPGLDGSPSRDDVAALLARNPVASRFTDGIQLLSAQGKAIHWARRMLQPGVACVLDTETHDLWGQVMEVAVVDAATGEVLLESLVNPQIPVTEDAFDVHRISDAMVADAPTWDQVLPDVLRVTAGRKILAYNAEYDKTVIVDDCLRVEADPQHLRAKDQWGCIMRRRSDWEGVRDFLPLGGRHRALGDACAALEMLTSLASAPEWVLERAQEKVSA